MNKIRVRFAPSPTGPQHIGGLRTALYNYLLARKLGGAFILRIEDTDETRFVPESEAYLEEALAWLSIVPDEGPRQGGDFGPYRQSERKHLYHGYAEKLIENGYAYYAFDTPEALDEMRERQKAIGLHTANYNAITRMSMQNGLTLSQGEVRRRIATGEPYVVRLRVDPRRSIRFHDEVRGWIEVQGSALDDKVLLKQGGMPTYHLANVVDDHLMEISQVIRGEEWLPSTPLHCLMYEGLGWKPPVFAHLPLLLRHDGLGKLSKRSVDKSGKPMFPLNWYDVTSGETYLGFREAGYLPEAVLNFIALLGWHPGSGKEVMPMAELANHFSLKRINKAGVQVDVDKAAWFNQCYLRQLSGQELADRYLWDQLKRASIVADRAYVIRVCDLVKQRIHFPREIWEHHRYFFVAPRSYAFDKVASKWHADSARLFDNICTAFTMVDGFEARSLKGVIKEKAKEVGLPLGTILPLIRMAVSGVLMGPELMDMLVCLGRERVLDRLNFAKKSWTSFR